MVVGVHHVVVGTLGVVVVVVGGGSGRRLAYLEVEEEEGSLLGFDSIGNFSGARLGGGVGWVGRGRGGEGRGWGFVVGEAGCGGEESQCRTTPSEERSAAAHEGRRLPIAAAGDGEESRAPRRS